MTLLNKINRKRRIDNRRKFCLALTISGFKIEKNAGELIDTPGDPFFSEYSEVDFSKSPLTLKHKKLPYSVIMYHNQCFIRTFENHKTKDYIIDNNAKAIKDFIDKAETVKRLKAKLKH